MARIDTDTLHLQWALSYPFPRPQSPFVFLNGASWPLIGTEGGFGDWLIKTPEGNRSFAEVLPPSELAALNSGDYHAVAAVGSNAAPAQLRRKFRDHLDNVCIPVLQIDVPDHVVAYANRIAAYGSIPATLVPHAGGSVRVWATLLSARDYAVMNATEDRGSIYDGIPISPVDLPEAITQPFEAYACLTGHLPLLVSAFPSTGCDWPVGGQWEAQAAAIQTLGLDLSVDRFVLENTSDPKLRNQRDRALSGV
jgi:hypothetical protein